MYPISKERFNAHPHKFHPNKILICIEVAWFESKNNKILGTITFDLNDKNYGFVLFGRNEKNLFFYIDGKHGFTFVEEALQKMEVFAQSYEDDSLTFYPDDQEEFDSHEILEQKISKEDQHKFFSRLINEEEHEAARNLLKEIGYAFEDADGNFINTFRSIDGFNARLFELYLFQYFRNANFIINKDCNIPDFCLSYFGNSYFVEATTVNAGKINAPNPRTVEEMQELWLDYMSIKFSKPLVRKLEKRYWEKEHVKGHPFIIAIHDYHQEGSEEGLGSMTWSGPCLQDYLYGVREDILDTSPINYHEFNGKKYQSGFFKLENAEYVSAVLYSNQATLSKFNRMGKLAGMGGQKVKMLRYGSRYDIANPNVFSPKAFIMDIDDPLYKEDWSEGLVMYHNPYAKYPVEDQHFDISHIHYKPLENRFYSKLKPFDVICSITRTIKIS